MRLCAKNSHHILYIDVNLNAKHMHNKNINNKYLHTTLSMSKIQLKNSKITSRKARKRIL